jgi:nitroimidazol reductase NimA-like FMN-containing flavoprotein (pyridoxamine 5'-phosphate oxidase superfamily)
MSLENLTSLLIASKEAASAFTLQLEGQERTAEEVQEFINQTQTVTIAVVRKNGLPHAAPVIGLCLHGEVHVTVSSGSVLAGCLRRSSEVAFTVVDLVHSVIGAGRARNLGHVSELEELRRQLDQASPFGRFAPEGWDGYIFRLEPRRIFAF